MKRIVNISRWDSYAFVIILFAVVIQLLKWRVFPIFIDIYYHLLTAVGFNEAGGWVGHCFWEFAPVGRPQVYPPLLHIIILFLIKAGIPILTIGKLIQFAIYPLLIFVIWYVIKEIFNSRQAFFTILMVFPVYSFYLTVINTCAASLALIFCLLSLLFLEKKKIIPSAILLAVAFFTHGYTSWIFLSTFVIYAILNKKASVLCLKTILLALCLASPIIILQLMNIKYFCFQKNIIENCYIELNLLDWAVFLFGFISCLRKKGNYYLFCALFISSAILLFNGIVFRFLSFYGIISIIFMNAVFLNDVYDKLNKKQRVVFIGLIISSFFIFSPTLTIDLSKESSAKTPRSFFFKNKIYKFNLFDSNLANFALYCSRENVRGNEVTVFYPRLFSEAAGIVLDKTQNKDILYVNYPYTAGVLSLLSGRAVSTAMLSEVAPYKDFDKIAVSKLIVWQKDPDDIKKEPVNLIEKYNLKKIADTGLAFIYENQKCSYKKQVLPATINYKLLFLLVFLVFILILWSMKFNIDKY